MVQSSIISKNKTKIILSLLFLVGIGIRFHHQFLEWSYNGDEVDLGWSIINTPFKDLFAPLPNRQSAPPLFLLLEKILSYTGKPFITLKILSFLSSCISLFLFHRILKKFFPFYLQIILLAVFCFNPFIIANSLTLKQYTFDLLFGLVALNYFNSPKNIYKVFLFFSVFCLISNTGPFFCVAFAIYFFLKSLHENKSILDWKCKRIILAFIIAPIPYVIFFFWFMQQPGAVQLKNYMTGYWSQAFIPLNRGIFNWFAIQAKILILFFFSSYWFIGIPMLLIFLTSIFFLFRRRQQIFDPGIIQIIFIYFLVVLVHLILNSLKIYPFSDRLLLYLAPGIYLILGYGILQLKMSKMLFFKAGFYSSTLFIISGILSYFTYLPRKENEVNSLLKFLSSKNEKIVFTHKASALCRRWLEFTAYDASGKDKERNFREIGSEIPKKTELLVAVQSKKFGHLNKLSSPEPIINKLIDEEKITLLKRFDGYVIYQVK